MATAPFLDQYTFVGGSALALHLCHRKSEDLDFFTYTSGAFDKSQIHQFIARFDKPEILNESDEQIDLLLNEVKVSFFDAKWAFLHPPKPDRFNLASLSAIAAMKVNVLFLRAKYRDYYDLYFLTQALGLQAVFEAAQALVPGLTFKLFCVALLYIDDIADDNIRHLDPLEKISKTQIRAYFEKQISQS